MKYLASVRLRAVVISPTRKTNHLLLRHDNTADAPSSFLAKSDVKMAQSLIFFRFLQGLNLRYRIYTFGIHLGIPLYNGIAACATFR